MTCSVCKGPSRPPKGNDRAPLCKLCYSKHYYRTHKRKSNSSTRRNHLKRHYGLSEADFNALADSQNHRCAICLQTKTLLVDHSHSTNVVRGLLCRQCNTALGLFYDNPTVLRDAADYIAQHNVTGAYVDMHGEH